MIDDTILCWVPLACVLYVFVSLLNVLVHVYSYENTSRVQGLLSTGCVGRVGSSYKDLQPTIPISMLPCSTHNVMYMAHKGKTNMYTLYNEVPHLLQMFLYDSLQLRVCLVLHLLFL